MKRMSKITTEQIVSLFKEIHKNLYDYTLVKYRTMHHKVILSCTIHGKFEVTPNQHIRRKVGCARCAVEKNKNKQKDTTENFISKAKKIHKERYKYCLVKYGNNAHDKVIVICRVHGAFLTSPNAHLAKQGCSKCGKIAAVRKLKANNNLGWNRTEWIKRCNTNIATLYIIRCYNEEENFIKIGVTTKEITVRFKSKAILPYNYEVLKIIKNKPGYIYDLEHIILRNSKEYQYEPKIKFKGDTECRNLNFNYLETH